ncbi:MAG: hypothetical protein JF597_21790 [Streptomyces sp.]|nr:hypothetical protein [Streptomyces sp.]
MPAIGSPGRTAPARLRAGLRQDRPDDSEIFNRAVTSVAAADVRAVVGAYDFTLFGVIADVGGGRGHRMRGILDAVPGAKAMDHRHGLSWEPRSQPSAAMKSVQAVAHARQAAALGSAPGRASKACAQSRQTVRHHSSWTRRPSASRSVSSVSALQVVSHTSAHMMPVRRSRSVSASAVPPGSSTPARSTHIRAHSVHACAHVNRSSRNRYSSC